MKTTFHVGYAVSNTSSERPIFKKGCIHKHAWDVSLKPFPSFWFEAGISKLYLDKCRTLIFRKNTSGLLSFSFNFSRSQWSEAGFVLFLAQEFKDIWKSSRTLVSPIFKNCFLHYHVTPDASFQFFQIELKHTKMNWNFHQGPAYFLQIFKASKSNLKYNLRHLRTVKRVLPYMGYVCVAPKARVFQPFWSQIGYWF